VPSARSLLAGPRRASIRRAAATCVVVALGLAIPASSSAAEAPAARSAARVELPKLAAGTSVQDAVRALRSRGFRAAVVRADGYPKARPGHAFVAAGWAVERRTSVRVKGGRRAVRVRYVTVRPGSRHAARTRIHVRPKQVRSPSAPTAPATPAPAAVAVADAAPAPASAAAAATAADAAAAAAAAAASAPAVNAGGTPVIAGPPPASLDTVPDAAAPPASSSGTGAGGTTSAPQTPAQPAAPSPAPKPAPAAAPVDLAAETARFLHENTVHLPFMDSCTGFLVRDGSGAPIGAVSAIHCGLLPARAPRVTGADGRQYVVVRGPLEVRNGEDVSRMRSVATAHTVTLPPATDGTHDLALVTFAGASTAQVRTAYEAMRLSQDELDDLRPGRTVTLSAFPRAQPLNTGVMRRQVMTATVLGQAPVSTTSGRTIPTVWTAMKANADGAVCSYGASGGAAVTADLVAGADGVGTPVFRLLGVLSGYDDYRPAAQNTVTQVAPSYDGAKVRAERQVQTGFDLRGADATCDYAHQLPSAGSAQTVRLVTSAADIPR